MKVYKFVIFFVIIVKKIVINAQKNMVHTTFQLTKIEVLNELVLSVLVWSTWSYIGCNTFWLNSVKISTAERGDEDLEPPKVYSESANVECSDEVEERLSRLSFSSQERSGESGVVVSGSTIKTETERPRKYSGNMASSAFVHCWSWSCNK